MVLDPAKEGEAEAIFRKWGLDFAVVGQTTNTLRFVVKHRGAVKADLPIKELGDAAPVYARPYVLAPKPGALRADALTAPVSHSEALLRLLASPDLCSKRWVYEQYDHLILGNTVQRPGGDAAVIRIGDGPKGLALTTDVTQRYCKADPYEGGKQAVAEAWRNLCAVGALPRAITDNLNFGNPERPEIMGELVGCIEGIAEACRLLDFPVVSGNVSLYNETSGRGIAPTPAIGGVGLIEDVRRTADLAFKREGDEILLIGQTQGFLGQSLYARDICACTEGAPPPVDLLEERRNGDFVRTLIAEGRVTAAHDISDGGLAVAIAEMALAGGIGAGIAAPADLPEHAFLFGEDQARYILTAAPIEARAIQDAAKVLGIACEIIGTTGGDTLTLCSAPAILMREFEQSFETWLPAFMAGKDQEVPRYERERYG